MWDFILEVLKEMLNIFLVLFENMSIWGPLLIIFIIYFTGFGINYGVNYLDELKYKALIIGVSIIIGSLGLIGLNIYAKKNVGFVDDLNAMNYYMYAILVFIIIQMALPEINIPIQEFFRGIREEVSVSRVSDGGVVVEKSAEAIVETTGWGMRILVTLIIVFVSLCMSHLIFKYVPFFIAHKYTFYSLSAVVGLIVLLIGFAIPGGISSGGIIIERQ